MGNKLKNISESVRLSLDTENYFAALTTSLILIDTCSSIHFSEQNLKVNERYKQWCDSFLIQEFNEITDYLSSNNIWFLRNAMLHQSSSNPTSTKNYEKYGTEKVKDIVPVVFPKDFDEIEKGFLADTNEKYDTLFFDINYFCEKIIFVVNKWMNLNIRKIENSDVNIFSIAHTVIDIDNPNKLKIVRF